MYCQLLLPTPSGRCLVKLAMLLVFCCFAESAAGSCIRYGHSCWGAHGKRSHHENAPKNSLANVKNDALLNDDARWFIARLLQTNDRGLKDQVEDSLDGANDVSISESEQKNADIYGANDVINDKFKLLKYL